MAMSHILILTSVFEVIRLKIFFRQILNNEPSLGKFIGQIAMSSSATCQLNEPIVFDAPRHAECSSRLRNTLNCTISFYPLNRNTIFFLLFSVSKFKILLSFILSKNSFDYINIIINITVVTLFISSRCESVR